MEPRTYLVVVPSSRRRFVRRLLRDAGVCAQEKSGIDAYAAFAFPETIKDLSNKVEVLMVLVPKNQKTTQSQRNNLESLVREQKVQLGMEVDENDAVKTLSAFFEPKSLCKRKGHKHGSPHQ